MGYIVASLHGYNPQAEQQCNDVTTQPYNFAPAPCQQSKLT